MIAFDGHLKTALSTVWAGTTKRADISNHVFASDITVQLRRQLTKLRSGSIIYMDLCNLCEQISSEKLVGKRPQLQDGIMEPLTSKAEQIQS